MRFSRVDGGENESAKEQLASSKLERANSRTLDGSGGNNCRDFTARLLYANQLKWLAFVAVALSTAAVVASVVVIPLVYTYVQRAQSSRGINQRLTQLCSIEGRRLTNDLESLAAVQALTTGGMDITKDAKRQRSTRDVGGSCCRCSVGEAGDPGPPGVAGQAGPDGPPGPNGPNGLDYNPGRSLASQEWCLYCQPAPRGEPGPEGGKGPPGPPGLNGRDGTPGIPGARGFPGDFGPVGDVGAPGAKGPVGRPGALVDQPGSAGPVGLPGLPGHPGGPGPAGLRGLDGRPGPAGEPGEPGPPGAAGRVGLVGPPGPSGPAGSSAVCDHCPPPRLESGYHLAAASRVAAKTSAKTR